MRRRCTCPPDGSRYCPACQALLQRAGFSRMVVRATTLPPPSPLSAPLPPVPLQRADRFRSETERRYGALLTTWQQQGIIQQWWYEPCKGLWLAPRTSYTPDFLVWRVQEGLLEFHEVIGVFVREKDLLKVKLAAVQYPVFRFLLARWKDGAWHWREVPSHNSPL